MKRTDTPNYEQMSDSRLNAEIEWQLGWPIVEGPPDSGIWHIKVRLEARRRCRDFVAELGRGQTEVLARMLARGPNNPENRAPKPGTRAPRA